MIPILRAVAQAHQTLFQDFVIRRRWTEHKRELLVTQSLLILVTLDEKKDLPKFAS